jgi:hypothetical protein
LRAWLASTSPQKNCHGVRKARAEVAAYSECTEAQMMAMFGWRDHKMPALHRQSKPGQACDQRDGENRGLPSDGEHRRSGYADRPELNSNFRE